MDQEEQAAMASYDQLMAAPEDALALVQQAQGQLGAMEQFIEDGDAASLTEARDLLPELLKIIGLLRYQLDMPPGFEAAYARWIRICADYNQNKNARNAHLTHVAWQAVLALEPNEDKITD
jgi:hypothetical protein